MNNQTKKESLKSKDLHILKFGNIQIKMEYSKNSKSLNECILNILKQKIKS